MSQAGPLCHGAVFGQCARERIKADIKMRQAGPLGHGVVVVS
jgi:hypothetical protein